MAPRRERGDKLIKSDSLYTMLLMFSRVFGRKHLVKIIIGIIINKAGRCSYLTASCESYISFDKQAQTLY